MPDQRGTLERGDTVAVGEPNVEVIAVELRLFKEELGRRFDEQRELGGRQAEALALELRALRTEMSTNYVSHQAYQAEYGRVNDRIANVEADVVEIRTSLATSFVDIHGHIDRRFNEILQQVKDDKLSRRWVAGVLVSVALAVLGSITAISVAVYPH